MLLQFGTDLFDRFQRLWIHRYGVRPAPAEKYTVRTSSWDVVEVSLDESGLWTPRGVVSFAALQQILFNIDPRVLDI